jgi:hypothetical protein
MELVEHIRDICDLERRSRHLLRLPDISDPDEFDKVAGGGIFVRWNEVLDMNLILVLGSRIFPLGAARKNENCQEAKEWSSHLPDE